MSIEPHTPAAHASSVERRVCLFTAAPILFILAACGNEPPTVGPDVAFSSVCDKANKGKRVATVGYLRLPARFKTKDRSLLLRIYEDSRFAARPIGVETRAGSAANQVEKPVGSFSDKDLKVHLADGSVATLGTKVKVSGEMYIPLIDQKGKDEGFACGLTNPLIEKAPGETPAR